MHIFMHHLSLYFDSKVYNLWDHCADIGSWIRGQIRTYEGRYRYYNQHWLLAIIEHANTKHIAIKYVIKYVILTTCLLLTWIWSVYPRFLSVFISAAMNFPPHNVTIRIYFPNELHLAQTKMPYIIVCLVMSCFPLYDVSC